MSTPVWGSSWLTLRPVLGFKPLTLKPQPVSHQQSFLNLNELAMISWESASSSSRPRDQGIHRSVYLLVSFSALWSARTWAAAPQGFWVFSKKVRYCDWLQLRGLHPVKGGPWTRNRKAVNKLWMFPSGGRGCRMSLTELLSGESEK